MNTTSYENNPLSQEQLEMLLGADNYAQMLENHRSSKSADHLPVVHLSIPCTDCHWLLTDIAPNSDVAFGLCDLGMGFPELGYVRLGEIISCTRIPPVERNNMFKALAPISRYHEEALKEQQIVLSWEDAQQPPETEVAVAESENPDQEVIPLADFLNGYRQELIAQVEKQTPVLFDGKIPAHRQASLERLKRQPFTAQKQRIAACACGLFDHHLPAIFLNGEMGTGKTMMGICLAKLAFDEYVRKPTLVISPPHLVYKWRREILDTIDNAIVHVVNGSQAIHQLLKLKDDLCSARLDDGKLHFVVIGRVRMRMGFYWQAAFCKRKYRYFVVKPDPETGRKKKEMVSYEAVACPDCGQYQMTEEGHPISYVAGWGEASRKHCQHCREPLWSMRHKTVTEESQETKVRRFLIKLPGIGKVSAEKLLNAFGADMLSKIIDDNVYDFVNLSGADGEFWFSDKQAERLEKALGRLEFALRMISYQPSEFIKRYFPRKCFGLALIDEAHEYKNGNSAQGQAMGVLCTKAEKILCLTGTLMGGYASDLFYLLFRTLPGEMIRKGYRPAEKQSLGSLEMRFMRDFGCLIEVMTHRDESSFKTARGKKVIVSTKKAPGFSPQGIAAFVLPYTVFMRLSDLEEGILPTFHEETRLIAMEASMRNIYDQLVLDLQSRLREAIAQRDFTLVSTVINVLLRWPDTCFRAEVICHPHKKEDIVLASTPEVYCENELTPKEEDVLTVCLAEKAKGRRVMIYTTYTGEHDTVNRLKTVLSERGNLQVGILRSSVASDAREDWFNEQIASGVEVVICHPELVKTGLDLLAFPTLYFMQTGYNLYTVTQASRRSWRIGQTQPVTVYYACYENSAQIKCLELMAKKTKTALSTQGIMPETGLDVFDTQDCDTSVVESLAKQLLEA